MFVFKASHDAPGEVFSVSRAAQIYTNAQTFGIIMIYSFV